ncbi:MAG: carboxypeptidase-like regulatory domain-containing protein [Gemmatimonadales bacterium]
MRMALHFTLAGFALATAVACTQAATTPTPEPAPIGEAVVFRGTVMDIKSSAPLGNVGVELAMLGSTSKPFAAAVTDEHGAFEFPDLRPGTYMLHVGRAGYIEVRMRVEAKASPDKPLDLRLRALTDRQCAASRYHTLECP